MPAHLDWPVTEVPDIASEYDRYAGIYDSIFNGRINDIGFYVNFARQFLPEKGTILELGTGTGRLAEYLVNDGFNVIGVDFSRAMLEIAKKRKDRLGNQFKPVYGDVRQLSLNRNFRLITAPFGMMAHLISKDDRRTVLHKVFQHLEPGGTFIFDDMPNWLSGPATGDDLELIGTAVDAETGFQIRATSLSIDVAAQPLTLCYHYLDWLDEGKLVRRITVRVIYRNSSLEDELELLAEAGFNKIELLGGFDGAPFDLTQMSNNKRLIIHCKKSG